MAILEKFFVGCVLRTTGGRDARHDNRLLTYD